MSAAADWLDRHTGRRAAGAARPGARARAGRAQPRRPLPAALAPRGARGAGSACVAHPGDRSVALDLLAADALITLALLAQAQEAPGGARRLRRLAAPGRRGPARDRPPLPSAARAWMTAPARWSSRSGCCGRWRSGGSPTSASRPTSGPTRPRTRRRARHDEAFAALRAQAPDAPAAASRRGGDAGPSAAARAAIACGASRLGGTQLHPGRVSPAGRRGRRDQRADPGARRGPGAGAGAPRALQLLLGRGGRATGGRSGARMQVDATTLLLAAGARAAGAPAGRGRAGRHPRRRQPRRRSHHRRRAPTSSARRTASRAGRAAHGAQSRRHPARRAAGRRAAARDPPDLDAAPAPAARRASSERAARSRPALDRLAGAGRRVQGAGAAGRARGRRATPAVLRGGGTLFFCGNGGSAADAQHLATEYVVRYAGQPPATRRGRAHHRHARSSPRPATTWASSRSSPARSRRSAGPGDLLVLHSTSGQSPNLLAAARAARARGVRHRGLPGPGRRAAGGAGGRGGRGALRRDRPDPGAPPRARAPHRRAGRGALLGAREPR